MRCNDGEVTREADEGWRENKEVCHVERGWRRGRHGKTKSSLESMFVCVCAVKRACVCVCVVSALRICAI